MNVLAWSVLVLCVLSILIHPCLEGRSRGKYDMTTFMSSIIEFAMLFPLIGRVLGWF